MVENSKEYQISDECNVSPMCQKGVFDIIEGVNSKNCLLALLMCSGVATFLNNNSINF